MMSCLFQTPSNTFLDQNHITSRLLTPSTLFCTKINHVSQPYLFRMEHLIVFSVQKGSNRFNSSGPKGHLFAPGT